MATLVADLERLPADLQLRPNLSWAALSHNETARAIELFALSYLLTQHLVKTPTLSSAELTELVQTVSAEQIGVQLEPELVAGCVSLLQRNLPVLQQQTDVTPN